MNDPLAHVLDALSSSQEDAQSIADQSRDAQERQETAQNFLRLDNLTRDADVGWFFETYLRPILVTEEKAALNPTSAAIQGPVHANRHEVAKAAVDMLWEQYRIAKARMESLPSTG